MSKMGQELDKRLEENKYEMWEALKLMTEGNELDPHNPNRAWSRTCPSNEAVVKASQVLAKIEGK